MPPKIFPPLNTKMEVRRRRLIRPVATKFGIEIPANALIHNKQLLVASIPRVPILNPTTVPLAKKLGIQIPPGLSPLKELLTRSIPSTPTLKSLPLVKKVEKEREIRNEANLTEGLNELISNKVGTIPTNQRYRVTIKVNIRFSDALKEVKLPMFVYEGRNLKEEINRRITEAVHNENWTLEDDETLGIDIQTTSKQHRKFDYKHNRMRDNKPFNLSVNIFNNLIHIEPTKENCVKTYLRTAYPDIAKQKKDPISSLGTDEGVTPDELLQFCKERHIKMIAYNTDKKVIATHKPEKFSKKYKALIYLYYGNHIYPIENKYLETKTTSSVTPQFMSEEDLKDKFHELISAHILPSHIHTYQNNVDSFIHENINYFHNPEYQVCEEILKAFGIEDKINPHINFITLMDYIENIYTQSNTSPYISFFPIDHIKTPMTYNSKPDITRPLTTIDKNKAYSHAYQNLPYLLSTDYRTTPIITNPIIEEYSLYIATPKIPNLLMPKQDIYSGQHLIFCKSKFSFTIQEQIKCKHHENIYREIIQDLHDRIPEHLFKLLMNKTIGSYARSPRKQISSKANLLTEDDLNPNNFHIPYGNYFLETSSEEHVSNIYNRRPIAIQIKDRTAQTIYNKMVELNLKDDDIVQIKTDSITFYTNSTPLKLGKTINDWKLENYKPSTANIYDYDPPTITMKQTLPNNNTIITGYAGNGKSYYIQNMDLTDSIILSSKHSALTQHRNKNLNADVIQAYAWGRNVPKEHHIIVEECGILSRHEWDIIFKCRLLGKKLTVFGDFQQLLPVGESHPFNSPAFLDWMFATQTQMNTNWRNSFTVEYYDSLINSKDQSYLKHEILKYTTKNPEDAEVIFAYRNTTVHRYNAYMIAYLNNRMDEYTKFLKTTKEKSPNEAYIQYYFDTHNTDNIPMICITNKLRDQNIYNQYQFTTTEIRAKITDPEFDMLKHFRPAYARTLYNLQGDQVKSYYIAPEDIDFFTKPREAYTIISRLMTSR